MSLMPLRCVLKNLFSDGDVVYVICSGSPCPKTICAKTGLELGGVDELEREL